MIVFISRLLSNGSKKNIDILSEDKEIVAENNKIIPYYFEKEYKLFSEDKSTITSKDIIKSVHDSTKKLRKNLFHYKEILSLYNLFNIKKNNSKSNDDDNISKAIYEFDKNNVKNIIKDRLKNSGVTKYLTEVDIKKLSKLTLNFSNKEERPSSKKIIDKYIKNINNSFNNEKIKSYRYFLSMLYKYIFKVDFDLLNKELNNVINNNIDCNKTKHPRYKKIENITRYEDLKSNINNEKYLEDVNKLKLDTYYNLFKNYLSKLEWDFNDNSNEEKDFDLDIEYENLNDIDNIISLYPLFKIVDNNILSNLEQNLKKYEQYNIKRVKSTSENKLIYNLLYLINLAKISKNVDINKFVSEILQKTYSEFIDKTKLKDYYVSETNFIYKKPLIDLLKNGLENILIKKNVFESYCKYLNDYINDYKELESKVDMDKYNNYIKI